MKKVLFAILALLAMVLFTGCAQSDYKDQVKVEFIEEVGTDEYGIRYINAVEVTNVGEHPIRMEVRSQALSNINKPDEEERAFVYYEEIEKLKPGESAKIVYENPNVKLISVVDYEVEFLPQTCDLSIFAAILAGVLVVATILLLLCEVEPGSGGAGAGVMFLLIDVLVVFVALLIVSGVIELLTPWNTYFEIFNYFRWDF